MRHCKKKRIVTNLIVFILTMCTVTPMHVHAATINDEGDYIDYGYTGTDQTFEVPVSGKYRIAVTGGQGGTYNTYTGGTGGSVTIDVNLEEGEKVTISLGKQGSTSNKPATPGGYAGGASGLNGGAGGSASVVKITDLEGTTKEIIVAAGGAGANYNSNGNTASTTYATTSTLSEFILAGGIEASGAGGNSSTAAGGGGGIYGGNAGSLVFHDHSTSCYSSYSRTITLNPNGSGVVSTWMTCGTCGVGFNATAFGGGACVDCGTSIPLRQGNASCPNGHYNSCNRSWTHTCKKIVCGKTPGTSVDTFVKANGGISYIDLDNEHYAGNVDYAYDNVGNGSARITFLEFSLKITDISLSTTSWTNQNVNVTVSAVGDPTAFSLDNFATSQTSNILTVTTNGTYTAYIKNAKGKVVSQNFTVSNIDKVLPTASIDYTQKPVQQLTVTVTASDADSGINNYWYEKEGVASAKQSSNVFTITENGNYEFKVSDKAGNVTSMTAAISNIDTTAPGFVASQTSAWENVSKEITLSVSDNMALSKVEITGTQTFTIDSTATGSVGTNEVDYTYTTGDTSTYKTSDTITLTVTDNGTLTITVTDVAGNTYTDTVVVDKMDKNDPVITLINPSKNDWTNDTSITLTVTADDAAATTTDAKSGLAGYSIDGSSYQVSNVFTVTENGTYTIYVKDYAGNVTTDSINVAVFDRANPTIDAITPSKTSWTNDADMTLTITASDDASGVDKYSINGGSYQSSNVFTITENGIYTISIKDRAGNITSDSITITNFDRLAPDISLVDVKKKTGDTYSSIGTDWTNDAKLYVFVSAEDKAETLTEGKSNSLTYSIDGTNYGTQPVFEITANGSYTLYVKDTAGNITTSSITVANFDRLAPVISSLTQSILTWTNASDMTITVSASDQSANSTDGKSDNLTYSMDGTNYQASNVFTVTDNGTYTLYVKDAAGNTTTDTISITEFDRVAPTTAITQSPATTSSSYANTDVTLNSNATDMGDTGAGDSSGITSYVWFKDDVVISGATSSTYTATESGVYKVTVTDNAGNSTTSASSEVFIDKTTPNLTISAMFNGNSYVADTFVNGNVDITVTDSVAHASGYTVAWYRNDTLITGATSLAYTATQSGTYKCVVTTNAGNSAYKTYVVKIDKVAPTTTISQTPNTTSTSYTNVDVELDSNASDMGDTGASDASGISSYVWYKDGAVIVGETSSTYTATESGAYKVVVTDVAGNSTTSAESNVYIDKSVPVLTVSSTFNDNPYTENTFVNGNVNITVSDSVSHDSGYVVEWYKNDVLISTATSLTYTATSSGAYKCKVITKAGNSAEVTLNVKIDKVAPTTSITQTPNTDSTHYANQDVLLDSNASDEGDHGSIDASGIASYTWYKDGTVIAGETSSTYTATVTGSYKVTVTDVAGNSTTSAAVNVYIDKTTPNLSKTATLGETTYTEDTFAYADVVLTVTDSETHESGYTVEWYKDLVLITGETSLSYIATETGTYKCIVSTKAGNSAYVEFAVKVDKVLPEVINVSYSSILPAKTVTATLTVTVGSSGVKAYRYIKEDGTEGSWQASNILTLPETGVYKFEVKNNAEVISAAYTDSQIVYVDNTNPVAGDIHYTKVGITYVRQEEVYFDISDNYSVLKYKLIAPDGTTVVAEESYFDILNDTDADFVAAVQTSNITLTVNGKYKLEVTDIAGNVTNKEYSVETIDVTNPTAANANISSSVDEVKQRIAVSDNKKLYRLEVYCNGTLSETISLDGLTETKDLILDTNGAYLCIVYDEAGNSSSTTFMVTCIVKNYNVNEDAYLFHVHYGTDHTTTPNGCFTEAYDDSGITKFTCTKLAQSLGYITLKKVLTDDYYLEVVDNTTDDVQIVGYSWTGRDTTAEETQFPSIHPDGKMATSVTGQTTARVLVPDFGYYICELTYMDKISGTSYKTKHYCLVDDYDMEAPTIISVDLDINDWTTSDITATIVATDNMSVTGYACSEYGDLADARGLIANDLTNTFVLTENNTYYFYARDAVGNTSVASIDITWIDRDAPELKLFDENGTTKVTVTVNNREYTIENGQSIKFDVSSDQDAQFAEINVEAIDLNNTDKVGVNKR